MPDAGCRADVNRFRRRGCRVQVTAVVRSVGGVEVVRGASRVEVARSSTPGRRERASHSPTAEHVAVFVQVPDHQTAFTAVHALAVFSLLTKIFGVAMRRALRIIYPVTYDFPYDAALSIAQMASLFDRREQLNRHFFKLILSQSFCIFSLLPPPRNLNVTSRLRTASTYPLPTTRTKRYTSFVQHGLLHYQTE